MARHNVSMRARQSHRFWQLWGAAAPSRRRFLAALLLVDDEDDVLAVLSCALTTMGHSVMQASSGIAALQIIDRREPLDLLLTDVVMPGLHGFNLARMVLLRRPDIRILYMTGFAEVEMLTKDTGPRHGKLLMKPLHPDQLARDIDEALAPRRRAAG
jgi:two-component system, cell cycle sensor histidine kinase and response regulator CckA